MTPTTSSPERVLAVDPISRGFGFAVLEGPVVLVDWGVRETREHSDRATVAKIDDLIRHYQPDLIVVENCGDRASRRGRRARTRIAAILAHAATNRIDAQQVAISAVRQLFGENGVATKYQTAWVIAEHFPALAPRLPPKRKPWMPEAERMAIFDAVGFGLTYYFSSNDAIGDLPTQSRS